jgi:formylglycine-generating enzyme required for sulfatase activity
MKGGQMTTAMVATVGTVAMLLAASVALGDVFNMGPGLTSLETVNVGNAGNAADTRYATPGYGAVSYEYKIGKYEVTAGQYTAFLNAVAVTDTYGLYSTDMDTAVYSFGCNIKRTGSSGSYAYTVASDWANRPVNTVSFWDAARFTNWLHNGQPTGAQGAGTTERGTYTLDGYTGSDGRAIQRNADWKWAITSEDEWYKAAYYKGGSTNAGYWDYPTRSNTAPGQNIADASGNNANYYTDPHAYPIHDGKYTTIVGEFQNSAGPYGTFDQGGNVWELNEAIPNQSSTYAARGQRGGAFYYYYFRDVYDGDLLASYRGMWNHPTGESFVFGFRVASQVPEPATMALLAMGGVGIISRRLKPT